MEEIKVRQTKQSSPVLALVPLSGRVALLFPLGFVEFVGAVASC